MDRDYIHIELNHTGPLSYVMFARRSNLL